MSFSNDLSRHEPWSTTAPMYSSSVGRTSALAASRLLQLAHGLSPLSDSSVVLDNGAGTGAVALTLALSFPSAHIVATDISASMLANISAQGLPNVSTRVLDALALSKELDPESFSHVFSTFVLQTITTPTEAVEEMYAILAPGGVVGIGLWARRNGPFEIWERACQSIDPAYVLPAPFDDPKAWRTQEELESALKQVRFREVVSEEVMMPFPFESTAAFMKFWFEAKNPASLQVMTNWKGDMEDAKRAVARVVKEEYADGKEIYTWAVLGVGRK